MEDIRSKPYNPYDLSFTLSIKLDIPPAPMSAMFVNIQADTNAKLVDIEVKRIYRYDSNHAMSEYGDEQKNSLVVFDEDSIEFVGHSNFRKRYEFPTNQITMKTFVDCIVDFEKNDRLKYEWVGGIDCHHIFYEGIDRTEDGAFVINWGS